MANRHTRFAYAPPAPRAGPPVRAYLIAAFSGALAFALVAFAIHSIWS